MNQWINAEVITRKNNMIKVHFTGYHEKYDDWLNQFSEKLQPQWTYGKELMMNNRIDVLDEHKKWY